MKTPTIYDPSGTTAFWVGALSTALREALARRTDASGVTPRQWVVLAALRRPEIDTPRGLCEYLGIDAAGVTRLLTRLESKALVSRSRDDEDRRRVRFALTDTGRQLAPEFDEAIEEVGNALHAGLAVGEVATFRHVVDRMLRNLGREGASLQWLRGPAGPEDS